MEENLRTADEGEPHAQAEETAGVGDVGSLGDLLVFLEALGIRVLDEDVKHDQVLTGVVQNGLFNRTAGNATSAFTARDSVPASSRSIASYIINHPHWYIRDYCVAVKQHWIDHSFSVIA